MTSRVLLRRAVSRLTGTAEVELGRRPCPECGEPHGRPYVVSPDVGLEVSLSHAGDLVCVAVGAGALGIDVEPYVDLPVEVVDTLHPREQADLLAVEEQGPRARAFTRLWTRKEAYLKALGTGLTRPLDADYLGPGDPSAWPSGWRFDELELDRDHSVTLCTSEATTVVEVRREH